MRGHGQPTQPTLSLHNEKNSYTALLFHQDWALMTLDFGLWTLGSTLSCSN